MIATVHAFVLPAAAALLPPLLDTREARALLLAIGLQESRFVHRRQLGPGPARGFWQFERGGGVAGVLTHALTQPLIARVLDTLRYPPDAYACHVAIEHNDVLAACFARLLLATVPGALPERHDAERGWQQYLHGWRPGKPHRATWDGCYAQAWALVDPEIG